MKFVKFTSQNPVLLVKNNLFKNIYKDFLKGDKFGRKDDLIRSLSLTILVTLKNSSNYSAALLEDVSLHLQYHR